MAARRLLIVMLVLLGLSTLAAALIPQRTLRDENGTGSTTRSTTTTQTNPAPVYFPPTKITVGGKKFPIVSPVHVGDQFTLLVKSRFPTQLSIPEFGQFGFAAPSAPARFELLAKTPGIFGVLFVPPAQVGQCVEEVAARIQIVPVGQKPKKTRVPRCGARGGSGRA
jgi:hypothetical protein